MSTYSMNLEWKNSSTELVYEKYNRDHTLFFSGDQSLKNSAAPEFFGNAEAANPEELLLGALASCHMLTFLAIAAKSGYIIQSYKCEAKAVLGKNAEGKMAVIQIDLLPQILFSGEKKPTAEQLQGLHEKSHRNCFIAQSIKPKVNILS